MFGVAGCPAGSDSPDESDAARRPAPDFTLERLDGEPVTLSALRGKTVIIDFWATWCPPCEFQVPELNAFYEAHASSGRVAVLGISVDSEERDVVAEWVRAKDVKYPVLLGSEALARRFGAMGFPSLAVVDPDGNIDTLHVGLIERADLEEDLARVQARFPAETAEGTRPI